MPHPVHQHIQSLNQQEAANRGEVQGTVEAAKAPATDIAERIFELFGREDLPIVVQLDDDLFLAYRFLADDSEVKRQTKQAAEIAKKLLSPKWRSAQHFDFDAFAPTNIETAVEIGLLSLLGYVPEQPLHLIFPRAPEGCDWAPPLNLFQLCKVARRNAAVFETLIANVNEVGTRRREEWMDSVLTSAGKESPIPSTDSGSKEPQGDSESIPTS